MVGGQISNVKGAEKTKAQLIEELKALKQADEEKVVLLRQFHHRVKSNLQVITSLLRLQARGVKAPDVHAALLAAESRIQVITLIHEGLLRSDALVDINFPVYIANVMEVPRRATGSGVLKFTKDIADVHLDSRYASPVGLVVNELVSNAIEHAFPDNRAGEVRVALRQVGENEVELLVSDDGVGLPDDINLETVESMGLKLVSMLVEQLGGTVDVSREAGTSFTIRFANPQARPE